MKIQIWNDKPVYLYQINRPKIFGLERIGDSIAQFDGLYIYIRQFTIVIYWERKG